MIILTATLLGRIFVAVVLGGMLLYGLSIAFYMLIDP